MPYVVVKQLSFKHSRCFTMCFNPNTLKSTRDINCGEGYVSGIFPVEECDELIGVDTADYAKILKPSIKKNIYFCNDLMTDN